MRRLQQIDTTKPHRFITPIKRINEGHDVSHFLTSRAYTDIGTFVMQLNTSMCPRKVIVNGRTRTQAWELGSKDVKTDGIVKELRELLSSVEEVIQEAPPDTGPRRFGNVSFRKWYALIEDRADALLRQHIPATVLDVPTDGETTAMDEIKSYFMGSWGSAQRLDFGTGHELSFLAFLGCLWKLRAFGMQGENLDDGEVERSIVLGVLEP
jgi:serine/threonine-protein phosphatase 2A activator